MILDRRTGGEEKNSRILPKAVKDRVHALAVQGLQHARDRGLSGRARRPDDRRPAHLDELRK